jgi:hypothetical protein
LESDGFPYESLIPVNLAHNRRSNIGQLAAVAILGGCLGFARKVLQSPRLLQIFVQTSFTQWFATAKKDQQEHILPNMLVPATSCRFGSSPHHTRIMYMSHAATTGKPRATLQANLEKVLLND